jgi:hypothetical protein
VCLKIIIQGSAAVVLGQALDTVRHLDAQNMPSYPDFDEKRTQIFDRSASEALQRQPTGGSPGTSPFSQCGLGCAVAE